MSLVVSGQTGLTATNPAQIHKDWKPNPLMLCGLQIKAVHNF